MQPQAGRLGGRGHDGHPPWRPAPASAPSPASAPAPGPLHHSDRGSQYAGDAYRLLLRQNGVQASMSRAANCYDNAAMESFWATLKTELIDGRVFDTRAQARSELFDYIEVFYNRARLHGALGYQTPVEYEHILG